MTSRVFLALLLLASPALGIQCLYPNSDISGDWDTPGVGTPHNPYIDENTACDDTQGADLIVEDDGSTYTAGMTSGTDPEVSTGHTWYCWATIVSNKAHTLTVDLYQGTTKINTSTTCTTSSLTGTPAKLPNCTLTGTEADTITDYTALRLELTAVGTSPTDVEVDVCNIELPDAPSAGDQFMLIGQIQDKEVPTR